MSDFKQDFMGYNYIWFIGEVEDRNDPLRLGRVKIRCFGWHNTDKEKQPTADLPWASTVQPVTAPAASASGLTVGTWVTGFFLDGEGAQRPIVVGQIPGYRYDDDGANGESELPRAARVEENFPSPQSELRKKNREGFTNIEEDFGTEVTWNEPEEPNDAEYPFVQTIGSESGILTQIVSKTANNEARRTEYHPSGTYNEVTTEGDSIAKIMGDHYSIVAKDSHVYIKGKVNLTIDTDCVTNIEGNWKINVKGNKEESIGGSHKISAGSHDIALGSGTITTEGKVDVNEVQADKITDGDIELGTHRHKGVQTGSGFSGKPIK